MPTTVVNQHQHQGFDTPPYVLKKSKLGGLTIRNERHIRSFPGDSTVDNTNSNVENTVNNTYPNVDNIWNTSNTVNNIVSSIMKRGSFIGASVSTDRVNPDTDCTELSPPCRATESNTQDIRTEQGLPTHSSAASKGTNNRSHISWAKTIEVVYLDNPLDCHSFFLLHHFATYPRQ